MFAGTQLDMVIGLDLHMEMVPTPAPVPTPFPMPFVGIIEPEPLGFLIELGMAKALSWAFSTPPTGPVLVEPEPGSLHSRYTAEPTQPGSLHCRHASFIADTPAS